MAFSRCSGWLVADVLFHLLCDAQRALVALVALVALASPASGPPDRDFVKHHLDMSAHVLAAPAPDPRAIAVATHTLDGLLGPQTIRPPEWSTQEYLLKATGRTPLSSHNRQRLAGAANRFPLLS